MAPSQTPISLSLKVSVHPLQHKVLAPMALEGIGRGKLSIVKKKKKVFLSM